MVINHNIASLNASRMLEINSTHTQKAIQKLSSGLRINGAADDAAGLAISEKMKGQINGLDQASRNAQDGISLIQTAEGALNETQSILQRMRELAVQSSNDTNTDADRQNIQDEIDQLSTEVTRISTDTEFNTKKLLNGNMGKVFSQSVSTATLTSLKATGADLGNGTYTLTLTSAGTDNVTVNSSSVDASFVASDITVNAAAHIKYGDYTVQISNYTTGSTTADITVTGPDGTSTTAAGLNVTAAQTVGGLDLDFATNNVSQNGTIQFTLADQGLKVDLSGAKTANMASATYTGGNLNVGGFQFSVLTNHGASATVVTGTLNDQSVKFQIGANAGQSTSLSINNMSANALGVDTLVVTNQTGANAAISSIDTATTTVSAERSKLGAMENRLEHTINNLGTTSENLTSAQSRIADVDMASEMTEFTKDNILSQAAQAMLAQANQQPQGVLQLLR